MHNVSAILRVCCCVLSLIHSCWYLLAAASVMLLSSTLPVEYFRYQDSISFTQTGLTTLAISNNHCSIPSLLINPVQSSTHKVNSLLEELPHSEVVLLHLCPQMQRVFAASFSLANQLFGSEVGGRTSAATLQVVNFVIFRGIYTL